MGYDKGKAREGGLRECGTEGRSVLKKGNRGKMDLEEREPKENGLRERGTEGRCVKREGNRGKID
jgi:hypothetical protein